jgi:hypothetical protein
MSLLNVNTIEPSTGTDITLGASGDTITVPSGATFTNSGTATGFSSIAMTTFRLTSSYTISSTSTWEYFTANLSSTMTSPSGVANLGSVVTESSGVFTFPSTGYWLVGLNLYGSRAGDNWDQAYGKAYVTINDSSYSEFIQTAESVNAGSGSRETVMNGQGLIDVTDTANVKCKFGVYSTAPVTFWGQSGRNATYFTFLKLADT